MVHPDSACFNPIDRTIWYCHACHHISSYFSSYMTHYPDEPLPCRRCSHDVLGCHIAALKYPPSDHQAECIVTFIEYEWNCWACNNQKIYWLDESCGQIVGEDGRVCRYRRETGGCGWMASLPERSWYSNGSEILGEDDKRITKLREYVERT